MSIFDQFIGLNIAYPLANGELKRRLHLDGAASPLVMQDARDAVNALLPHYSNSHSNAHASAHISAQAMAWSQQQILRISGANTDYSFVMQGSGSTAVINNLARRLRPKRQQRSVVFVSAMEHHANDLPHRQQGYDIVHMPLEGDSRRMGAIDLKALRDLFENYKDQVNYVAFSAVSNVTGIINPVAEITAMAHEHGAYSLVDAAQMAAHCPLNTAESDIDFLVFSGHKVYCAGSPGILIAKRALLQEHPSDEVGGGIVSHVGYQDYDLLTEYPAREHAGTKNILGIYALAKVMCKLEKHGIRKIQQHGEKVWQYAFDQLSKIEDIVIYGSTEQARIGALSFNINGIDHGLAASILSDYYSIAIRNECFCAHPYVSAMLKEELWELDLSSIPDEQHEAYINRKRGMLRASFSLYNNCSDVDTLCAAIKAMQHNIDTYRREYEPQTDGSYSHKHFSLDWQDFVGE